MRVRFAAIPERAPLVVLRALLILASLALATALVGSHLPAGPVAGAESLEPADPISLPGPTQPTALRLRAATVEIDLRPLAQQMPAQYRVVYELENPSGETAEAELGFLAPGGESLGVTVAGEPVVPALPHGPADVARWLPSGAVGDPLGGAAIPLTLSPPRLFAFRARLAPDERVLVVVQGEASGGYLGGRHQHRVRLLATSLAPASFGAGAPLRLRLSVPEGWRAESSVRLDAAGEATLIAGAEQSWLVAVALARGAWLESLYRPLFGLTAAYALLAAALAGAMFGHQVGLLGLPAAGVAGAGIGVAPLAVLRFLAEDLPWLVVSLPERDPGFAYGAGPQGFSLVGPLALAGAALAVAAGLIARR